MIMLGSLPPRVRELYGLRYGRREQLAFAAVTRAIRGLARRWPRSRLAAGWNTGSFERVAATERRRIASRAADPPGPRRRPAALPSTRYLRDAA